MNTRSFNIMWVATLITLDALAVHAQPLPATILINPQTTYLRLNNDPANSASPIDLAALGISPGDLLRLTTLGDFINGAGSGFVNGMTGVFSSNSVLLAANLLNRVPGAIPAGAPYFTYPTFKGSLPTDISQDFFIHDFHSPDATNVISTTNISIRVPPGAAYLFVSAKDTFFSDNIDNATNHFRVLIERGTEAVLTASIPSRNLVSIFWNTDSNQWYQMQSSFLLSNDWTNIGSPLLGDGYVIGLTNSTIDNSAVFYRVERVP